MLFALALLLLLQLHLLLRQLILLVVFVLPLLPLSRPLIRLTTSRCKLRCLEWRRLCLMKWSPSVFHRLDIYPFHLRIISHFLRHTLILLGSTLIVRLGTACGLLGETLLAMRLLLLLLLLVINFKVLSCRLLLKHKQPPQRLRLT